MSKNALISPNEQPITYVSGWTTDTPPNAIISTYPNSCRVAEVSDQSFEVASPLFWVKCEDNVKTDHFYYDTVNKIINPIVNVPEPT